VSRIEAASYVRFDSLPRKRPVNLWRTDLVKFVHCANGFKTG